MTLIEDRNHQVRRWLGGPGPSLVEDYVSGDPDAFDHIVNRYRPFLLSMAQRRLGSASDAEDAVQECLLRAYKGIARLDRTAPDVVLGRWLMRILFNVCTDVGIRRARQRALPAKIAALGGADEQADDAVGEVPDAWYLGSALADLPASQREAFVLREVDGLEYSAVAARTGISEDNARARVHRARINLKARLLGVQAHAGGAFALAGAMIRFRVWGAQRRVMMAVTRSGAGVHGSEVVVGTGGSAGATVATIAAGLATVGGGFLALPSSGPSTATSPRPNVVVASAAPSSATAHSSTLAVTPISVVSRPPVQTSPPSVVSGGLASHSKGAREVHAGIVVPSVMKRLPTPSTSTSTTVAPAPSSAPASASSSSDLTWVPGAESDGSSKSSSTSPSSSSSGSSTATPNPACQSLTSMPGAGVPSQDSPSFAGLNVTQLIESSQPAAMNNGFALFASPQSVLLPSVGATSGTSVQLTADICTVAPTQVLIADVSEPGLNTGMLQLRGALVATTATSDSTGAYFRGTTVALSPVSGDLAALPTDFVGELACTTSTGMCDLTIALVAPPAPDSDTTSTTSSTTTPSGTSDSSESASALEPPQILYSVTPPVPASSKSSTAGSPLISPNP